MEQKKREDISEIKRRILQFIEFLNITREEFYNKVSINGANFRGKSALSELSGDKIANILRCYPDLSPDWLLLGNGDILRSDCKNLAKTNNLTELNMIAELARENGQLQAENEELKNKLARAENKMAASAKAAAG